MNILFFLTPKADVSFVSSEDTYRQALEKMSHHTFASVPIVNEKTGAYEGTLTEGDLLTFIRDHYDLSLKSAESIPIQAVPRRRDYMPVSVSADIEDLISASEAQNFVPVVDDNGTFIGIVTRKSVIRFLAGRAKEADEEPVKAQTKVVT